MNKPVHTFVTPSGDHLVVLPEEEYLRLRKAARELADILAFDEAMERERAGEEMLSLDEVEKQLAKEKGSS